MLQPQDCLKLFRDTDAVFGFNRVKSVKVFFMIGYYLGHLGENCCPPVSLEEFLLQGHKG